MIAAPDAPIFANAPSKPNELLKFRREICVNRLFALLAGLMGLRAGGPKLTWGGQASAEVLADNRYDHSKSPVHPTGHCHGRDRYASFRDRYAKHQTAPSDQARRRRALA